MRRRVNLRSHDGSRNSLVFDKFENGYYVFHLETQYINLRITKNGHSIIAIDPSGGPMMGVGDTTLIGGMILEKISLVPGERTRLYFKSIKNDARRTE